MSLYGKDDSNANVTKAGRGIAASDHKQKQLFSLTKRKQH